MALKNGKPNSLNFFGLRRVEFSPPHFVYTDFNKYSPGVIKQFDSWIKNNLNGRYYLGQELTLDHNNTLVYVTKIGFEIEKELSFFKIACPILETR